MRGARTSLGLGLGLIVALTTGCGGSEDDWVVHPPGGGGGGGGGGGTDAGSDGGGGVIGRLCLIDDLRAPDVCPTTADARGVRIRVVGGPTVITTDDRGSFVLPALTGPLVLEVDGTAAVIAATARMVVGPGPLQVPAVRARPWQDVLDAVGVPGLAGQGGVVIYVDDASGAPQPGVTVSALAGAAFPVFYDDGAATRWRTDGGTGAAGVALMLQVPAITSTVVGVAPGTGPFEVIGVPIRADAVTFVRTAP